MLVLSHFLFLLPLYRILLHGRGKGLERECLCLSLTRTNTQTHTHTGVGPQVAHSGCPLLFRDGLNTDGFHYIVLSMTECHK